MSRNREIIEGYLADLDRRIRLMGREIVEAHDAGEIWRAWILGAQLKGIRAEAKHLRSVALPQV